MTSVTTKPPGGKQRAEDPGRALLDALTAPPQLAVITLLSLAFVAAFAHFLYIQSRISWGNHDWNHSYFVPVISGWLLWQHRAEVARIRPTVFWPGLAPFLLGLISYPAFVFVFKNHMGQGYSLVLALFGLVLLLTGPRLMKFFAFPIGYLAFAVTLPEMVMSDITFRLRQLAATGGYVLLQVLGTDAELKGSTLHITNSDGVVSPLDVADACSGMSMVIAFLALGAAMALVGLKEWWQRVVLVLLAIPVAILLNVLRIAVLGLAVQVNPNLATGEAHMLIGTLLLIPGFGIYLFIRWALVKSVSAGETKRTPKTSKGGAA
jgi:exosortase